MIDAAAASALHGVAGIMRDARDPWWVIGSAAVALHGVATAVADVDLLVSERDALTVIGRLRLALEPSDPHPLFRSRVFARWRRDDRDVEIMAGLAVADGSLWRSVVPSTRVVLGGVPVPDRRELMAILARFGRPKDRARRAMLATLSG